MLPLLLLAAVGCGDKPRALPDYSERSLRISAARSDGPKPPAEVVKDIVAQFDSIQIGQSVLVNECTNTQASWCKADALQFFNAMKSAASIQGAETEAVQTWKESIHPLHSVFDDFSDRWKVLSMPPVHLIAAVNRIDLARWNGTQWSGAELRLIYGANYEDDDGSARLITLILEFRYEPQSWESFQALAKRWRGVAAADFDKRVEQLYVNEWENSKFDMVRLRTNSRRMNHFDWDVYQWNLTPAGWMPAVLGGQLINCSAKQQQPPVACKLLPGIWQQIDNDKSIEVYDLPQELQVKAGMLYNTADETVGMPAGQSSLRPRNLLGLQQCTQCHLKETDTNFNHVTNRKVTETTAKLSRFLQGKNMPNASYDALSKEDPQVIHSAEVPFSCAAANCPPSPVERKFHDLGRRRLFLAAMLAAPAQPDGKFIEIISKYYADFTH